MNSGMLSPAQRLQVPDPIIKRVLVDMVNHRPIRARSVGRLPRHHSTQPPDVRLGHLDPRPLSTITCAGANLDRANWRPVHGALTWRERTRLHPTSGPIRDVATFHRAEFAVALSVGERLKALSAHVLNHPTMIPTGTSTCAFAGTGTTLAVADIHDRQATGIDLDPGNAQLLPERYAEVWRNLKPSAGLSPITANGHQQSLM